MKCFFNALSYNNAKSENRQRTIRVFSDREMNNHRLFIHEIVLGDRKLKLREIADTLKISEGTVFTILHESLGMRKLFSK